MTVALSSPTPGLIGKIVFIHAERPLGSLAFFEHRVDMSDHQQTKRAFSLDSGDQMRGAVIGPVFHAAAQFLNLAADELRRAVGSLGVSVA